MAAYDALEAAHDTVASLSYDTLTHPELLGVLDRLETLSRKQPAIEHRLIARLAAEASPVELGGTCLSNVLATRLRISLGKARRRIDKADDLGPRTALTGEPLPPRLPNTAAAQRRGQIGAEHVRIIRKFVTELPDSVDYPTREAAEADLAKVAAGHGPAGLRQAADRLTALLNRDGSLSDADRARRRHLTLGKQSADGMSKINGLLDPEARATLDAVLAKWAAPGMCNPDASGATTNSEQSQPVGPHHDMPESPCGPE